MKLKVSVSRSRIFPGRWRVKVSWRGESVGRSDGLHRRSEAVDAGRRIVGYYWCHPTIGRAPS